MKSEPSALCTQECPPQHADENVHAPPTSKILKFQVHQDDYDERVYVKTCNQDENEVLVWDHHFGISSSFVSIDLK
jgi:hypothetical protein